MSGETPFFTPEAEPRSVTPQGEISLSSDSPQTPITHAPYEIAHLGKIAGRDVRAYVPRGQARVSELPQTRTARYAAMLDRVSPGMQRFDNYQYDVFIQDSTLIACREEGFGTEVCYFDVYALGDHTGNEVGQYVSPDKAWNKANGENRPSKPETRMIARTSRSMWSDRAEVPMNLLKYGRGALSHAQKLRERVKHDLATQKRNQEILGQVDAYRERINPAPEIEVYSLAGD